MKGEPGMGCVGSERRIHRVFVTKNTEYHVRWQTCVAVRDLVTSAVTSVERQNRDIVTRYPG